MSLQNSTLNWYRENVEDFIANSGHVDMTMLYRKFLEQVSSGRYIMDLGCGAGGASLYFTQQGYQVLAVDGCRELCDYTHNRAGCQARVMCKTRRLFHKVTGRRTLKKDGVFYASFK